MEDVIIEAGYAPGIMGRCIEMHARHYAGEGFGRAFETVVAAGMVEFIPRLDNPANQIWRAELDGRIVGVVAIDGEGERPGDGKAHLRWFIVDSEARGRGVGRKLLGAALNFCDGRRFPETYLWTFRGLYAAHYLYQAAGFNLTDQVLGSQWGMEILEQRFARPGPLAPA